MNQYLGNSQVEKKTKVCAAVDEPSALVDHMFYIMYIPTSTRTNARTA